MDLPETIVAAMIGAAATVTTALFQIFSSMKSRSKVDFKPRKGSTMRSILAVLALMIASAVGGFLYSELLKQGDNEELRAMRMELRELKEMTAASRAPAQKPNDDDAWPADPAPALPASHPFAELTFAESVAYVPACRRTPVEGQPSAGCTEAEAQRIALCGSIPAYARVQGIDLFAQPDAMQRPWEDHRAVLEQDLGGARFTGRSFEYAQSTDLKAVCVNFIQWSSDHSHIARIVVNYGFGDASEASDEPAATGTTPSVIAAESSALPAIPQQANFVRP